MLYAIYDLSDDNLNIPDEPPLSGDAYSLRDSVVMIQDVKLMFLSSLLRLLFSTSTDFSF